MRRAALLVVVAGVVSAGLLTRPLEARASCAPPAALADAPIAFVGTVTDVSSGGRVARVRVEDVWRGQSIPATVQVVGTPDLAAAATSVDRSYSSGVQYLFVPSGGGPGTFQDNSCTLTQPYSASLAALRPAGAPGAPASPSGTGGRLLVIILLAVGGPALVAAALVLRRVRHSAARRVGHELG